MSEQFIICPGCNKRIRPMRRYPLATLAEHFGWSVDAACRHLGISGGTQKEYRCHGISRKVAETLCAKVRTLPLEVWPEIIDHDIEDISQECADDRCSNRFIPTRPHQKFCCRRCSQRRYDRERLRRRYQTDPEYRAKRLAKGRVYQTQARKARNAWFRQWRARKKAEREEAA